MVVIKAVLDDDVRRFTVADDVPYADLHARLCASFGVTNLKLKYTDSEGDLVTFNRDTELREAVIPGELLRIHATHDVNAVPAANVERVPTLNIADAAPPSQTPNEQEADMILDRAFETVSWLALCWLVFHVIPLWVLALGGVVLHKKMKARPCLREKVVRFLRTRRLAAAR